jgi:hypothetical protein
VQDGGLAHIDQGSVGIAGSAFGVRYYASMNSVINTGGGGPNYLPGNQPGLIDASSVYG